MMTQIGYPEKAEKKGFIGLNKDFLGFLASMTCAIHCALLPFILTIGALSGLAWLENPLIEGVFIVISLILAGWSIVGNYVKTRGNLSALIVVLLGFGLIIGSRFVEGSAEAILTTLGGVTIAIAHIMNWRFLRSSNTHNHSHAG